MRIGKLWLVVLLSALPAVVSAQVNVGVNVHVDLDADAYDSTAPGDPVESVDVFYDQLQPYGVWVDDPDIGRVFIPQEDNFVPYSVGHWQYTRLGFVWISSEPHAWATSHYGRWAYSSPYGRWVWSPDTEWGPAWVSWRQTDSDFGWAPLPPVRIAASYSPPIESWHYCGSAHILDANVTRYYEPRDRVVVIHRDARPIEHYQTVSNVKIVTGPPPSVLRDHRVEAKPVHVEQRAIGRWTPTEAHAQASRAQEHHATFEVENQKRLESNTRIHTAQTKVIETHPQLKVQADARLEAAHGPQPKGMEPKRIEPARPEAHPGTPARVEPTRPAAPAEHGQPNRVEPMHPAPNRVEPAHPAAPAEHGQPNRVEPMHPATPVEHGQPNRVEPMHPATPIEHGQPNRVEPHQPPAHVEPAHPAPARVEPHPVPVEHQAPRPAPARVEPARPAPVEHPAPARVEPARPAPAPAHTAPPARTEPREPEKK